MDEPRLTDRLLKALSSMVGLTSEEDDESVTEVDVARAQSWVRRTIKYRKWVKRDRG